MTTRNEPKLMVVSRGFPPLVIGGTVLVHNLLYGYKGKAVGVAGYCHDFNSDNTLPSPCPTFYHKLPLPILNKHYDKLTHKISGLVYRFIDKKIKQEKPDIMMGIFPEANFFIPAYQLAKKYKIPFYVYIHDLWLENHKEGSLMHALGLQWEKEIYTNAKRVFCITEQQIKHYHTKYGIQAELFPHSIIESDLEQAPKRMIALNNQVKKIVFSGTVSRLMNQDAIRTLIEAVNLLPDSYQLLFLTSWKKEDFEAVGIQVGKAQIKWCSKSELKKELAEADILVAPLSFKNCSLEEVNSVFQTKLIEYFISGRPILAFSPATAFQTKLAQTQGWAKTCTEDNPEALAEMIQDVIHNEQLGQQLVSNALKTAQERAATLYSEKLFDFVNSDAANA